MALENLRADPAGEFALAPPRYLAHLLFQLVQRRQALLDEALEKIGLNGNRWRVLYAVWGLGGCTMSEVSRITGVDRTTLTRAVDRLVEEALILRSGSPHDRRQVILTLTPLGMEAYEKAQAIQSATTEVMVAGIAEADQRRACRLLEVMLVNTLGDPALVRDIVELRISARDPETAPT
jgi:DNA-binding MarR family transcriptional regulator